MNQSPAWNLVLHPRHVWRRMSTPNIRVGWVALIFRWIKGYGIIHNHIISYMSFRVQMVCWIFMFRMPMYLFHRPFWQPDGLQNLRKSWGRCLFWRISCRYWWVKWCTGLHRENLKMFFEKKNTTESPARAFSRPILACTGGSYN